MRRAIWALSLLVLMTVNSWGLTVETASLAANGFKFPMTIIWPNKPKPEKLPAVMLLHGSSGVLMPHKMVYAREFAQMGFATIVVDIFSPHGIKSTASDQDSIGARDMAKDAIALLQILAQHPRLDADKIALIGFSKGGSAVLYAAHAFNNPGPHKFALLVALYPSCNNFWHRPKTTGVPIRLLVGEDDTYTNPDDCKSLASLFKEFGSDAETVAVKGARHGWDVPGATFWQHPGENWYKCRFVEISPHNWVEDHSKIAVADKAGWLPSRKEALKKCITRSISGGYDAKAAQESMKLIKLYVSSALK